jgi:hypothetical protein
LFRENTTVAKKIKSKVELKYSLLNEEFVSAIGKRLSKRLQDAIAKWKESKEKQTEAELIDAYVQSLVTYWKKSKLRDFKKYTLTKDIDLTVDLVYKKGRKPNSIRLQNNKNLKDELLKLDK